MVDWHAAGKKAVLTRKRREAARKAVATRKRNQQGRSMNAKPQPVRALTIRQPWAELILLRRKHYEIRSWSTKYRGPLVIHSAARLDSESATELGLNPDKLVASAFVGIALLTDVRPYTRDDARLMKRKRGGFGGWSPGLFAWVLTTPRLVVPPIKAKGKLGLITVPSMVLRRIGKLQKA